MYKLHSRQARSTRKERQIRGRLVRHFKETRIAQGYEEKKEEADNILPKVDDVGRRGGNSSLFTERESCLSLSCFSQLLSCSLESRLKDN